MKREALTHWKFDALREALGLARYEAVGILETLWWWTAEHRDDGRLTGITPRALAAVIGWKGDADDLVRALVDSGWLDDGEDCYTVHDWHAHCPKYVHDRRQKRVKARDARGESAKVGDFPRKSANIVTGLDEARQGKAGQEHASRVLAREDEPPRSLPPKPEPVPALGDPIAAAAEAMREAAGEIGAAWTRGDRERCKGAVRELVGDGKPVPLILDAWGRFAADDFWRGQGLPPLKFREHFARYAASPKPKARDPDDARRSVGRGGDVRVCECGHSGRHHGKTGGRCLATGCECEAFREMREEVSAS